MKKIFILFTALFIGIVAAHAISVDWYVDGSVYDTITCTVGDNITPPTAPTKRGYTFQGWKSYTPIEYLESTGTQYIDLNTSRTSQQSIQIETSFKPVQVGSNQVVFGSSNGSVFTPTLQLEGLMFLAPGQSVQTNVEQQQQYAVNIFKYNNMMHVDVDHDGVADYFGNMTTADVVMHAGSERKLKLNFNNTIYSIYDDTVTIPE